MYLKRTLKNESDENVKVLVPTNIAIVSYDGLICIMSAKMRAKSIHQIEIIYIVTFLKRLVDKM